MEFKDPWIDLQKTFNLVEENGKIFWQNKKWTGQTRETITDGINKINKNKKWTQIVIRLKIFFGKGVYWFCSIGAEIFLRNKGAYDSNTTWRAC